MNGERCPLTFPYFLSTLDGTGGWFVRQTTGMTHRRRCGPTVGDFSKFFVIFRPRRWSVFQMTQTLATSQTLGPSDGDLLADFLEHRRQEAFEEIVRRHGGMVMSVCNSVLHNRADAEDAAQAVFLTLAKRASSLRGRSRNRLIWRGHRAVIQSRWPLPGRQERRPGMPRRIPVFIKSGTAAG
jgi:hypothetical protein